MFWVGWIVSCFVFQSVFFSERTGSAARMRPPCRIYLSTNNESWPRERSDRGRFLPLRKKNSSYRSAYRVPSFNYPVCVSVPVCVTFVVFTDCESCSKPIFTKRKISAPPKTHHEIHSRPATATNSRRRATKHVARGSQYSRASSIDPGFVEISLACIHAYPHCCCFAACIRFGALFSCHRSFCFLYCDTRYVYIDIYRFRGFPVVLDIELSVSAGYQKTGRALLRASCLVMLLRERRCAVCGITLEIPCISGNKRTIWCQSENEGIPPRPSHTHIKKHFFFWELPVWTCELDPNDR